MNIQFKWTHLVIALIVFSGLYFFFIHTTVMPSQQLVQYDPNRPSQENRVTAGGQCAQEKCLTVYVAPWCPACRRAHNMIVELVNTLEAEGIPSQVVIGMDDRGPMVEYANTFPFPVLFDGDQTYFSELGGRGVPFYAVFDNEGIMVEGRSGGSLNVEHMRGMLGI